MKESLDFFRCNRCSSLVERSAFARGLTFCPKCGSRQFTKARVLHLFEFVVYMARNPRLAVRYLKGAEINV